MKHFISCLFLFSVVLVFPGCGGQSDSLGKNGPKIFVAALWNVQALFDGEEQGNEYRDFLEASGWTAEKYAARITALSRAILQMIPEADATSLKTEAPHLIGFVEVENTGILEELTCGALSKYGYKWTCFANLPGSSLGLGVVSRFPIVDARSHSITIESATSPRPVLEVRIEPGGKPLVFLLCHWKSKLGGEDETEALRRASARIVLRRLIELGESEPLTPVIVMGDLNENHDEFSRRSIISALLPDHSDAAALTETYEGLKDFLVISGDKPPRSYSYSDDIPALYSPWEDELTGGSYYFRGEWETIDHFLLSAHLFDGSGWDYADCKVLNYVPFIASDGKPNSYIPRNGMGLSDHLPLLLYLEDKGQ